jgi:multiple sugar transport system substrate-binding protein
MQWTKTALPVIAATVMAGGLVVLPAVTQAAAPPVTLTISTWDSGTGLDAYKEGIAAFEKEYPNVRVNIESVSSTYYQSKLLTQLASGAGPDLMLVGDSMAHEFVSSGQLLNLNPVLSQYHINPSHFVKAVWDFGIFGGKQYFITKDWADEAVLYNKTMFTKAHIPFPKAGWTWQQFAADAKKLTLTNSKGVTTQYGAELPGTWLRAGLEAFAGAWGGRVISPNGKTVKGYLNSPKTEAAIKFYLDLYNVDHISPTPTQMASYGSINLFETGRVAMEPDGPWDVSQYDAKPGFQFGVAPMPLGPTGKPYTMAFWSGWAINKNTAHLTQAKELLAFFASPKWAQIDAHWAMPALKNAAAEKIFEQTPYQKAFIAVENTALPLEVKAPVNWSQDVETPLVNMIESATLKPKTNIAKLIGQTVTKIDGLLNQQG